LVLSDIENRENSIESFLSHRTEIGGTSVSFGIDYLKNFFYEPLALFLTDGIILVGFCSSYYFLSKYVCPGGSYKIIKID